jgi:hypothetical protein
VAVALVDRKIVTLLQTAIQEYRALKASGGIFARGDDLTVFRNALGIGTVGQQLH